MNGSEVSSFKNYTSEPQVALLGVTYDHLNKTMCWINHDNLTSTLRCGSASNPEKNWDSQPYLYSFEGKDF